MALRPRERPSSIASLWISQALADGLRLGCGANSAPKSVVTPWAGFEPAASESVVTRWPVLAAMHGPIRPEDAPRSLSGCAAATIPVVPARGFAVSYLLSRRYSLRRR